MKLFCCYTPAHQVLFNRYFLPTVPKEFSLLPYELNIAGGGDFMSSEFRECISQKISLIENSIQSNFGDVVVWSDIDIQLFELAPEKLISELGKHDVAFQRECRDVQDINSGFMVLRCNEQVAKFFETVRENLGKNPEKNEQWVINELIQTEKISISFTLLPLAYYARTQGWPPPKELALYHANKTSGKNGVQQKIEQFRDLKFLRKFRVAALGYTFVKYAPAAIARSLSRRLLR